MFGSLGFTKVATFLAGALTICALGAAPAQAASLKPAPKAPGISDVTSSSVKVSWAGISGVGTYRVKWSLKSDFDPAPTPASFGSSVRTGTITGLTPETKYYVQIVGYDAADKTRLTYYGKYATVTTAKAPVTPPPSGIDLRIGTFNLSGANNDGKASGDHQIWSERKPVVVSQIVEENSDVVGLQEAYQSTGNSSGSVNQYTDLRNGLNAAGKPFELTDPNKDASRATRIIYNTSTLQLNSQGSFKYANQVSGSTDRFLVWATFTQKSTGKMFFFANTHLSPNSSTVKKKEWQELIPKIRELNTASLPVLSVGDFNTSKFGAEAEEMLPAMKAAGFGDVMNQEYKVNPPRSPRAEVVVDGWINSFNDYRRSIVDYSYTTRHDKVGNGVDWIFATNALRVKQWKVVIDFDPATLKITGVIPSDHNMISSIVTLP